MVKGSTALAGLQVVPAAVRARVAGSARASAAALWVAVVCMGLVAWPLAARAEVAAADPIDAAMRTCLARADMSSTAGQLQCMDTARLAWQASIEQSFQKLLAKVPPAQRKRWQASEDSWKAWREAEMQMLAAVTATTRGTRYQLSEGDLRLQPVRDRALALRSVVAKAGALDTPPPLRGCLGDPQCVHASADVNQYYRRLVNKMPRRSWPVLWRAQQAWLAYRDATAPLGDARERIDLIGARVATLKKLAETAGND
ncbi:lysozyme inhibitor LprI family protein [Paraburkholderia sp. SARCC-3016]|uniref:lysozyme inhibitor LprI family protein n=1 Tax=Paraburkholderia sp. SARCC-3016 TaxID=3058611 RepID=UPI0035BE692B